ncbi:MAG: hypothetical protein AAGA43_15740 [Bacteroidota bacterium]
MKKEEENEAKQGEEKFDLSKVVNKNPKRTLIVMACVLFLAISIHVYLGYLKKEEAPIQEVNFDDQINELKKGVPNNTPSIMDAANVLQLMKEYEEIKKDTVVDTLRLKLLESKIKSLNPYEEN